MNLRRFSVLSLYLLANLLAQATHDHGPKPDRKIVGLPGCDDPRPHYSGHAAPEIRPGDTHCLACQFRADHHVDQACRFAFVVESGGLPGEPLSPRLGPPPAPPYSSRAPPSA